jgi:glycosyltransferase involved in cell wall biosynthesis
VKVAYHHSAPKKKVNGGALRYYQEVSELLALHASERMQVEPHDLFQMLRWSEAELAAFTRRLSAQDIVVSAVGPYAHLYFYLRERYGGQFRIVRDVRTSSWAGYLLQEQLAAPLLRPGDDVMFPSEFCRAYFRELFPESLSASNTRVCYPLASLFPAALPRTHSRSLRVGYVGRIAPDKNLPQLLAIFARLLRSGESRAELRIAGPVEGQPIERLAAVQLRRRAARLGIPPARLSYAGNLNQMQVWRFFADLDVLLFPAMASVESMGRIILEAAHAGVRVVAAHYAAAPELLHKDALIRSAYTVDRPFGTIKPFSFGCVDENDAVERVLFAREDAAPARSPQYQWSALRGALEAEPPLPVASLDPVIAAFLRSLRADDLVSYQFDAVMARLASAWEFLRLYNDNRAAKRLFLFCRPKARNIALERGLCWERLARPDQRMVLAHARQQCHFLGFEPRVRLEPDTGDRVLLDGSMGPLRQAGQSAA